VRDGLKAAGTHVYTGCENWIKENITQGLDLDGTAALDPEVFKAYDGGQESIFERKSTKGSNASASTPQQSSGASTGGAMPEDLDDEDGKERKAGCNKQESPVWKEFQSYQGEYKTDGDRVYRWDNSHKDIEVYHRVTKRELGSIDPVSGKLIRAGNPKKIGRF